MAKGKARDQRKEERWRRWVQEWRRSGLSVRRFCARHGLAEPSFYAWRRELERRQADGAGAAFIPVRVVHDASRPKAEPIEVLVGSRILRVAPGFDAATLRQVLAVLEDKPC